MSSSMAAVAPSPAAHLTSNVTTIPQAQFREIHKNTWLKRLTAEGKKVTVGPKKSERTWVVFCVHDDTKALLEGYGEPRQAAQHNPEWVVSLQDTLHISHALIPNSHEFEFVVTLSNEVMRFHAMSWEIMQEWVDTLRSKLREMKILSPRENLYTKLPEIRAPLLPTRDPTSPLPAPPPVPAAIVPGVERVVPQSIIQSTSAVTTIETHTDDAATTVMTTVVTNVTTASTSTSIMPSSTGNTQTTFTVNVQSVPALSAMSNTLPQNLLNMLSDPISTYNEQLHEEAKKQGSSFDDGSIELDENLDEDEVLGNVTDDEFFTQLLRHSNNIPKLNCTSTTATPLAENSVRVDICAEKRCSADQIKNLNLLHCERLIPRPHTSRSLSAGAVDKTRRTTANAIPSGRSINVTEFEISTEDTIQSHDGDPTETVIIPTTQTSPTHTQDQCSPDSADKTNVTIIEVSTAVNAAIEEAYPPRLPVKNNFAEVFKFPDTQRSSTTTQSKHCDYKSNVQIIPSSVTNLSNSTIQVLSPSSITHSSPVCNQYASPMKKTTQNAGLSTVSLTNVIAPLDGITTTKSSHQHLFDSHTITTVHVAGSTISADQPLCSSAVAIYGTCYTPPVAELVNQSTSQVLKKIILSTNTSGVTNISVNLPDAPLKEPLKKTNSIDSHYEKVFLSSSTPVNHHTRQTASANAPMLNAAPLLEVTIPPLSPRICTQWHLPRHDLIVSRATQTASKTETTNSTPSSPIPTPGQIENIRKQITSPAQSIAQHIGPNGSPALARRFASPTHNTNPNSCNHHTASTKHSSTHAILTRGLTEAVISTRPSRKDFYFPKIAPTKQTSLGSNNGKSAFNNNEENTTVQQPQHVVVHRTTSEVQEQRRRSSSTSDAQTQQNPRSTNNNESVCGRNGAGGGNALRFQKPPQPFRNVETGVSDIAVGVGTPPPTTSTNSPSKRMTLREQQMTQLRREIMHPGGVKLQLRRKDCVGSIAWVDAFGAVWVAGWKQKEHPVLYNALHIGDQLLSIAGVTLSSATEVNKMIRNTNTLFIEVLIRRLPFGRGYAIRRERECQCLGLIRDGNTSTIVDVVPNSLAARHGLPPKAQSCDSTSLTFWVLTEINGRPLNLFFKDNEIRDRLNSVGRDISILVQPSDLIAKLKKQLKSLRGYKDYLVQ